MIDILFFLFVSALFFLFLTILFVGLYWLSKRIWEGVIHYVERHGHPHGHHAS